MAAHDRTWSHTALRTLAAAGCATAVCLLSPAVAQAADHGAGRSAQGASHAHQGSGHPQTGGDKGGSHGSSVALHDKRWQAQADPDGSENGGVDQPGGQGGTIGQQDGNNGSGNDADCEDDNRGRGIPGHCKTRPGHQPGHEQGGAVTPPTVDRPTAQGVEAPEHASSGGVAATPSTPTRLPAAGTSVSGTPATTTLSGAQAAGTAPAATYAGASAASHAPTRTIVAAASPAAGVLPNTGAGAGLVWYAVAGAVAIGAGAAVTRRATR